MRSAFRTVHVQDMTVDPSKPPLDLRIPNAAWSGHFLVVADEDIVDRKLRRPLLSPSIAQGYNSCPARVVVDRLIPEAETPFAANTMGTAAHGVMEVVMALPGPDRTFDAAVAELEKRADEMFAVEKLTTVTDESVAENTANRDRWFETIRTWLSYEFLIEDLPNIDVAGVEFKLDNVEIGRGVGGTEGIPLKGFVDRTDWVIVDSVRKRLVDDYKFGKAKVRPNLRYGDDYGDQQRIYVEGYTVATGERPIGARLIFPRGLEGHDLTNLTREQAQRLSIREISTSPDDMRKTLLGFRSGWNTMQQSADRRTYEARPGGLCGWCPAANSCPVARIPNEKAQKAAAEQPSAVALGIPRLRPGVSLEEVREASEAMAPKPDAAFPTITPTAAPALNGEPDFETIIAPLGDDLFPITLAEAVPVVPAEPAAPSSTADPVIPLKVTASIPTDPRIVRAAASRFYADGPVLADDGTVHVYGRTKKRTLERIDMTDSLDNVSDEYQMDANGALRMDSMSATAVTDLVNIAFAHMAAQNVRLSAAGLSAFSHILAAIILRAQKRTTDGTQYNRGVNKHLRKFITVVLESFPAPFRVLTPDHSGYAAATIEDWQAWAAKVENTLKAQLDVAATVFDNTNGGVPELFFGYFAAGSDTAPPYIPVQQPGYNVPVV